MGDRETVQKRDDEPTLQRIPPSLFSLFSSRYLYTNLACRQALEHPPAAGGSFPVCVILGSTLRSCTPVGAEGRRCGIFRRRRARAAALRLDALAVPVDRAGRHREDRHGAVGVEARVLHQVEFAIRRPCSAQKCSSVGRATCDASSITITPPPRPPPLPPPPPRPPLSPPLPLPTLSPPPATAAAAASRASSRSTLALRTSPQMARRLPLACSSRTCPREHCVRRVPGRARRRVRAVDSDDAGARVVAHHRAGEETGQAAAHGAQLDEQPRTHAPEQLVQQRRATDAALSGHSA